MNIDAIYASKSLHLTSVETALLLNMDRSLLKAAFASFFLLAISLTVSRWLPRYLQSFHSSDPCLMILYLSVLSSFTNRFLFFNFGGMCFSLWSIKYPFPAAQPVEYHQHTVDPE